MAWDTQKTRRLLLDAAVEEFAEHGPAGARVAAIAARAGVNKERIYQYFGDKQGLFDAVLDHELAKLAAAVPLTAERAGDLAGYAAQVFDYHCRHPHFLRLLHWEGLQTGSRPVPAEPHRAAQYADKVAALAAAQHAGTLSRDLDAGRLLYAVIALAAWWFAVPQVIRMILGADAADDLQAQRDALTKLVSRIQNHDETPSSR